jgi:hypothetical protein
VSYAFPPQSGAEPEPQPGPGPADGALPGPSTGRPTTVTFDPQPSTLGRVLRIVGAGLLGVVVGVLGTVMFQAAAPLGLIIALAASLAGGLTARAWVGYGALAAYAIGWVVAVQVLSAKGPGGDVIVPAHHAASYVWVYGGFVLAILATFAPRSWFDATPRPRP